VLTAKKCSKTLPKEYTNSPFAVKAKRGLSQGLHLMPTSDTLLIDFLLFYDNFYRQTAQKS
jgi:hypothetical protein